MLIRAIIRLFKRDDAARTNDNPDGQKRSVNWRWPLRLFVCLAIPVFLETLDYTVVATAQPHIASVFHRLDLQSYIGTVYLLTSTAFLPLLASVADVFGRHLALQLSLLIFMVGSAISTGAMNIETLLAGRAIAGVGAAGLLTIVRVIIADSRSLDDNNWQVSLLFLLYAIGYIVGPVIGGALVSVSFRWIFAINLPCCAVAMVLSGILLRNKLKGPQQVSRLPDADAETVSIGARLLRIDWIGAFLFITGGTLLLLALNWGSTQKWNDAKVIASFVVGGFLLFACVAWEAFLEKKEYINKISGTRSTLLVADPMIPLQMFRSYDICAVLTASYVSGMVMLVMLYFVAIFMTIVTGLSPTKAGVQLIYFAPGMGAGTYLSITMVKILRQPKYPIILGSLLVPIALGLISMGVQQEKKSLINGFMVLAGVGIGLSISSLAIHARFSQPANRVAIVAAMNLFFRSLGGTVGLAQCAAVLNAKARAFIVDGVSSGLISSSDAASLSSASGRGGLSSVEDISNLPGAVQSLVRSAFGTGTRWAFISLIPWAAVAFILTLFLSNIKDTDRSKDGEPPEKPKGHENHTLSDSTTNVHEKPEREV